MQNVFRQSVVEIKIEKSRSHCNASEPARKLKYGTIPSRIFYFEFLPFSFGSKSVLFLLSYSCAQLYDVGVESLKRLI